jgi:hypothetical protein
VVREGVLICGERMKVKVISDRTALCIHVMILDSLSSLISSSWPVISLKKLGIEAFTLAN